MIPLNFQKYLSNFEHRCFLDHLFKQQNVDYVMEDSQCKLMKKSTFMSFINSNFHKNRCNLLNIHSSLPPET